MSISGRTPQATKEARRRSADPLMKYLGKVGAKERPSLSGACVRAGTKVQPGDKLLLSVCR